MLIILFYYFFPDGHEAYLDHAVELLDADLKPVPPQPNCPESMQVYEDHRLVSTLFRYMRFMLQYLPNIWNTKTPYILGY